MTTQKLHVLLDDYRDKIEAKFGPLNPTRDAEYSGKGAAGDTPTTKADIAHLYWMIDEGKELLKKDKVAKAMRWIGFLQHAMLSFDLLSLEDIKQGARDADEAMFPPPPGLNTMQAKIVVMLMVPNGGLLTILVRQTWLPQGLEPEYIKWPNIDPEKRLKVLEDLGIHPQWEVGTTEWDYTDCSLTVYLKPTLVHPRLSEESVALAIGMYKQAGWAYQDDDAKKWPDRMAKFRDQFTKGGGHHPGCPHHPQNQGHGPAVVEHGGGMPPFLQQLFGGMMMGAPQIVMGEAGDFGPGEPEEEPQPKPKKKKRKPKKNPPKGGKTDAGEGEEGSPDAAGPPG